MFKRVLFVGMLVLALLPLPMQAQSFQSMQIAAEKKDCTVYVTRTGDRYHRSRCSSLRKSRIAMSRSEAIKNGYTPCRRCGGSDCDAQ